MADEMNPYAPPAEEPYGPAAIRSNEEGLAYYPVSIVKLVVLSVMTLGLYDFYWMYKQWKAIRDHSGVDMSPFWRAFFNVWFAYALFVDVRHRSDMADIRENVPAGMAAAAYVILVILGRIANKVDSDTLWFISFLSVVPLMSMQGAINRYIRHQDPNADMNEGFGAGSIIAIVLGGAFWSLILFGMVAE
jgi:hypothetical protein